MDSVEFTVTYDNKEVECSARLFKYGYTFRIEVHVLNGVLLFEPDEEGLFRAITTEEDAAALSRHSICPDLVKAIAALLQEALS